MRFLSVSLQTGAHRAILNKNVTDLLRLLCCLLIALHHYSQYLIQQNLSDSIFISLLSSQGGYIGVAFFFFLSGFGLSESWSKHPRPFFQFIKIRFLKVYLPVVLVTVLWFIVLVISPKIRIAAGVDGHDISGINPLIRIATFQFYDSVLWFVKVILLLYLLFWVYSGLNTSVSISFLILILGSCSIMYFAYRSIGPFSVVSIPLFSFGVLVSKYSFFWGKYRHVLFVLSVTLALVCTIVFYKRSLMLHAIVSYTIVFVYVYLSCIFNIVAKALPQLISDLSYDIYITHNKVKFALNALCPISSLIVFFLSTILVSFIFRLIRKLVFR